MDYKYQLQVVKELDVQGKLRIDCPFCLNRKTFEVTNDNGKILWNCFHANCDAKGIQSDGFSKKDIDDFLIPQIIFIIINLLCQKALSIMQCIQKLGLF